MPVDFSLCKSGKVEFQAPRVNQRVYDYELRGGNLFVLTDSDQIGSEVYQINRLRGTSKQTLALPTKFKPWQADLSSNGFGYFYDSKDRNLKVFNLRSGKQVLSRDLQELSGQKRVSVQIFTAPERPNEVFLLAGLYNDESSIQWENLYRYSRSLDLVEKISLPSISEGYESFLSGSVFSTDGNRLFILQQEEDGTGERILELRFQPETDTFAINKIQTIDKSQGYTDGYLTLTHQGFLMSAGVGQVDNDQAFYNFDTNTYTLMNLLNAPSLDLSYTGIPAVTKIPYTKVQYHKKSQNAQKPNALQTSVYLMAYTSDTNRFKTASLSNCVGENGIKVLDNLSKTRKRIFSVISMPDPTSTPQSPKDYFKLVSTPMRK